MVEQMSAVIDKQLLKFQFKGGRNYIHGTDIFNSLIRATRAKKNICLVFHKQIFNNLILEPVDTALSDNKYAVYFYYDQGGIEQCVGLREDDFSSVEGRYPYDENDVVKGYQYSDSVLSLSRLNEYSFIEHIVSMNKKLLQLEHGESSTKWAFAKLELSELPAPIDTLAIEFVKNIGKRLTKSLIYVNGEELGAIYFSVFNS